MTWLMHERAEPQEPAELQPEEHARVYTAIESKLLRDLDAMKINQKRGAQRGNQPEAAGPSGSRAPGQARPVLPRQGWVQGLNVRLGLGSPHIHHRVGNSLQVRLAWAMPKLVRSTLRGACPHGAAAGLAQQANCLVKGAKSLANATVLLPWCACAGCRRRRASA